MITLSLNQSYLKLMIEDYSLFELWLNTQIYDELYIDDWNLYTLHSELIDKMSKLPNKLRISSLYIKSTSIEYLPNDINVTFKLAGKNSNLKCIPNSIKKLDYLSIQNTKITTLPKHLIVTKYLNLKNTNITIIPKGCLNARHVIYPDGSKIDN